MADSEKGFFVHSSAEVSEKAKIGKGTKIWNHAQIRENTIIGENCVISKNVYIDFEVKIGNNVKIQNNVNVYNGVELKDNVFVGPNSTFSNDLRPRAFLWNETKVVKTLVKEGASIGAGSIIKCGIKLGKYSMTGIGSVLTKSIPDHALAYGNPAKIKAFVCFCGNKLKKIKEEKQNIKMQCEECKKQVLIEKKDYSLIK